MAELLFDAEDLAIAVLGGVAATAVGVILCWVCVSVHLEFSDARCVTFGELLYAIGDGIRLGVMLIFFALSAFASFVYRHVIRPVLEIEIYRRT
jgi:hypothetical protein